MANKTSQNTYENPIDTFRPIHKLEAEKQTFTQKFIKVKP